MEFVHDADPKKIVRTTMYGDQEFFRFELELIHTPIYQRLYDLKQLGYSDRIFPDAVHSRFNHLLGVTEIAARMGRNLRKWLCRSPQSDVSFEFMDGDGSTKSILGLDLAKHVEGRIPVLRLMALLHDLTHAAFGHTLEDEVSVFTEKHDAPERQTRFFDVLTAQLVTLWASERLLPGAETLDLQRLNTFDIDRAKVRSLAREIHNSLVDLPRQVGKSANKALAEQLRNLETAFRLLLSLEAAHPKLADSDEDERTDDQITDELLKSKNSILLISEVIDEIDSRSHPPDLIIHRDMFLIDIIGNTICADLIDYAKRDAANAGLKVSFDDRILRYLCVVSVRDRAYVPGAKPAIRSAIQVFTNKLRHDVLSEMSGLLKARYLISERITFHPTKCAAGACLGTAVQLIDLRNLPPWLQALGDQAFLDLLMRCGSAIEAVCDAIEGFFAVVPPEISTGTITPESTNSSPNTLVELCRRLFFTDPRMQHMVIQCLQNMGCPERDLGKFSNLQFVRERAKASRRILLKLSGRRYPKLAYRLHDELRRSSGDGSGTQKIAKDYNQPKARYDLERYIEHMCHLPIGTVYIHCPVRNTSMKVAQALVVGNNLSKPSYLRTVTRIFDGNELKPYQDEICAIEEMYKSIWRFHIYVDAAHADKREVVAMVATDELGFLNDSLLLNEPEAEFTPKANVFDRLKVHVKEYAFDLTPEVVREIDNTYIRFRNTENTSPEAADEYIRAAILSATRNAAQRLEQPGRRPLSPKAKRKRSE